MDISSIVNGINVLLRHMVAGFVGIGAVWLFAGDIEKGKVDALVTNQKEIAIVVAATYGLLIYAVHRSAFYPLVFRFVYWVVKKTRRWQTAGGRAVVTLELSAFDRRHPDVRREAAAQRELDNWGAQIHFLYCCGWAVLGAWIYLRRSEAGDVATGYWLVLFISITFFVFAVISDWRCMFRHMAI